MEESKVRQTLKKKIISFNVFILNCVTTFKVFVKSIKLLINMNI